MDLSNIRVLIVEDSTNMTVLLRSVLKSFGVRYILAARDAAAAREACFGFDPDLALVDYELGDVTGVEFARMVRQAKDSPNRYLPIILVTGHGDRHRLREAIDAGVNEFVVKPVSAQVIYDRIRAVIERPRAFVQAGGYFGPDRRRRVDVLHQGPWRRHGDVSPEILD